MTKPAKPKPPKAWTECDRKGQRDRAKCKKLAEGLYCATRPRDPWCVEQRRRRVRDRQILVAGAAVLLLLVYFD